MLKDYYFSEKQKEILRQQGFTSGLIETQEGTKEFTEAYSVGSINTSKFNDIIFIGTFDSEKISRGIEKK